MSIELKKDLDYIVLTSDPGGDEHGSGNLEGVRASSLRVLEITAEYINKTPQVIAWINTGDIDDLIEAASAARREDTFDVEEFKTGSAAFYAAVDSIYQQCRLPIEQKLVVLGNHDIPLTFLENVEHCLLVGADILFIAQQYVHALGDKFKGKTPVSPLAKIGNIPIIGAMNTFEAPANIPQQIQPVFLPQCLLPGKKFYARYPQAYQQILSQPYYFMGHKGLLDKKDAFRKEEDEIHQIAAGSLASFEAHWHELWGYKVGNTYRFRSGTTHYLAIGVDKKTGKPKHAIPYPFVSAAQQN